MSGFLDTNVIIRYLLGDAPEMAAQATAIIDSEPDLLVTDAILAEVAHVLSSVYRLPREAIVDSLIALVQRTNVAPHGLDKVLVVQALLLCRPSNRVSFADAMLWAIARSTSRGAASAVVYSFDERFPANGIEVRRSVA